MAKQTNTWVRLRRVQEELNAGRLVVGARVQVANYYCKELIAVHGESPTVVDARGTIDKVLEIEPDKFVYGVVWDESSYGGWVPFRTSISAWLHLVEEK